jgi:hypothetical protein
MTAALAGRPGARQSPTFAGGSEACGAAAARFVKVQRSNRLGSAISPSISTQPICSRSYALYRVMREMGRVVEAQITDSEILEKITAGWLSIRMRLGPGAA